eukprot:PhM_4_TR8370/c1_g1_i1/m.66038
MMMSTTSSMHSNARTQHQLRGILMLGLLAIVLSLIWTSVIRNNFLLLAVHILTIVLCACSLVVDVYYAPGGTVVLFFSSAWGVLAPVLGYLCERSTCPSLQYIPLSGVVLFSSLLPTSTSTGSIQRSQSRIARRSTKLCAAYALASCTAFVTVLATELAQHSNDDNDEDRTLHHLVIETVFHAFICTVAVLFCFSPVLRPRELWGADDTTIDEAVVTATDMQSEMSSRGWHGTTLRRIGSASMGSSSRRMSRTEDDPLKGGDVPSSPTLVRFEERSTTSARNPLASPRSPRRARDGNNKSNAMHSPLTAAATTSSAFDAYSASTSTFPHGRKEKDSNGGLVRAKQVLTLLHIKFWTSCTALRNACKHADQDVDVVYETIFATITSTTRKHGGNVLAAQGIGACVVFTGTRHADDAAASAFKLREVLPTKVDSIPEASMSHMLEFTLHSGTVTWMPNTPIVDPLWDEAMRLATAHQYLPPTSNVAPILISASVWSNLEPRNQSRFSSVTEYVSLLIPSMVYCADFVHNDVPTSPTDQKGAGATDTLNSTLPHGSASPSVRHRNITNNSSIEHLIDALTVHCDGATLVADVNGTILRITPAVCALLKYEQDQLLGQNISLICPPTIARSHDQFLQQYLRTNKPRIMRRPRDVEAVCGDGTTLSVHLTVSEVLRQSDPPHPPQQQQQQQQVGAEGGDAEGHLHWAPASVQDQHHCNRLFVATLRPTGALRESESEQLRSKDEFINFICHEIRNPLNGVLGMVTMLQETPLTDEQFRYLSCLEHSGELLKKLLNDLLDFQRINAMKMVLLPTPHSIQALLESVVLMWQHEVSRKPVDFTLFIDPTLCPQCLIDGVRFKQVIINFLSNAFKFTSKGYVHVAVNVQEDTPDRQNVQVEIMDTGVGMREHETERLFTQFSQVDNTHAGKAYGGTGLGLHIARNLIQLMHGSVKVHSVFGEGSSFTLTIPVEKDTRPRSLPVQESLRKEFRSVVIEESELSHPISNALLKQLQAFGIAVTTTTVTSSGDVDALKGKTVFAAPAVCARHSLSTICSVVVKVQRCKNGGTTPTELRNVSSAVQLGAFDESSECGEFDRSTCSAASTTGGGGGGGGFSLAMSSNPSFALNVHVLEVPVTATALRAILYIRGEQEEAIAPPVACSPACLDTTPLNHHITESSASIGSHNVLSANQNNNSNGRVRALIVDDSYISRMVMQRFLRNMGFHVRSATNGAEAVEAYKRDPVPFVFMDFNLPVISGNEAAAMMREHERANQLEPTVMIAVTGDPDIHKTPTNFTNFLLKPVSAEALLSMIKHEALVGNKPVPSADPQQ